MLDVENPFEEAGRFRIILVESSGDLLDPSKPTALIKPKEKKPKKIRSKTDHGQSRPDTPPTPAPPKITNTQDLFALKKEGELIGYTFAWAPTGDYWHLTVSFYHKESNSKQSLIHNSRHITLLSWSERIGKQDE